jgi:hypothetical protein
MEALRAVQIKPSFCAITRSVAPIKKRSLQREDSAGLLLSALREYRRNPFAPLAIARSDHQFFSQIRTCCLPRTEEGLLDEQALFSVDKNF